MSSDIVQASDSWLEDFEKDPVLARELSAAGLAMETLSMLHDALSESGMTQLGLAQTLGITESAVSQVFNGDGNLRTYTFARYLRALGFEATLQLESATEKRKASPSRGRKREKPADESEAISNLWMTFLNQKMETRDIKDEPAIRKIFAGYVFNGSAPKGQADFSWPGNITRELDNPQNTSTQTSTSYALHSVA